MTLLIDNVGCVVEVIYVYDPLTEYLIDEYVATGIPQPTRIYKAWDHVIRELRYMGAASHIMRFMVDDDGTGNAVTQYHYPELVNAFILGVSIEGQEIDESDPLTVNINANTGDIVFGIGLTVGAKIKITYKK